MGSLLREVLKSICAENGWTYAVFWKPKQRNPMILAWEEGHFEQGLYPGQSSSSATGNQPLLLGEWNLSHQGNSEPKSHGNDRLGVLFSKMMDQVHVIGKGLMVLMMAMETSVCQHDSWQEQSLAEDSSELLCECTWPPRYYSCSFCRKEFKSAQALGGHMNVHRRDRARLRQSPNSQSEVDQRPCGFLDAHQQPPGVCSMVTLNPNSRPDQSSAPSAVSSYESSKHTLSQHSSYQEPPLCDPLSKISSDFTAGGDLKSRNNLNCDVAWQELALGSPDWLLGRRKMDEELLGSCDDETTAKRKRPRNCSTGYSRENAPSDLFYFQSIGEDLDLELRLGVSSKVD